MDKVRKETFVTPDRSKIVYEIWGASHKQAPLVLIMGLSGVKEDWRPFVGELAHTRPVLVYDRRGIGESYIGKDDNGDESELTLDVEAYDILHLLRSLGAPWNSVHILGWSMGGHILQALLTLPEARENPQGGVDVAHIHIRSAVLAATMTRLPRGEFKPDALESIVASADSDPNWKEKAATAMMEFQYDHAWLAQEANRKVLQERVAVSVGTRRPQRIIGAQAAAIAQRDVRGELPRIPVSLPVLVIHGTKDRMVAYSESDHIVQGIKHAKRLDMTPHTSDFGHFWFDYFGASWWAQQIDSFLQRGHLAAKL